MMPDAPDGPEENLSLDAVIREGLAAAERGETEDLGSFAQYAELAACESPEEAAEKRRIARRRKPEWADEPEEASSLAAMVEKLRKGEPVDPAEVRRLRSELSARAPGEPGPDRPTWGHGREDSQDGGEGS